MFRREIRSLHTYATKIVRPDLTKLNIPYKEVMSFLPFLLHLYLSSTQMIRGDKHTCLT